MAGALRLITFDVTNTLYKVSGTVGRHYADSGKMYGIIADEKELNKAFKHHYQIYSHKSPNFGVAVNSTPYKWWTDLVKDCFRTVGITNEEETLTQVANHLYLHFTSAACWELLPGVEIALMALRSQDFKMAVISNVDERLEKILKNVALRHHFDFILSATKLGIQKPDVRIFEKALELANVRPEQAIHVGDNVETDYLAAKNAGWRSYLVSPDKNVPNVDPKHIVRNLNEFVTKLDLL